MPPQQVIEMTRTFDLKIAIGFPKSADAEEEGKGMRLFWLLALSLTVAFLQSCSHGELRSRELAQELQQVKVLPALVWAKSLPFQGQRKQVAAQEVRKMKVGPDGHIYLCGDTLGHFGQEKNQGEQDVFVVKLDSSGEVIWTKMMGTELSDFCTDIVIDPQGNIAVVGDMGTGIKTGDPAGPFVATLNPTGELRWLKQFSQRRAAYAGGVVFNKDGTAFLSGFAYRDQIPDGFIQHVSEQDDEQGQASWAVNMTTLTGERVTQIFHYQDMLVVLAVIEGEDPVVLSTQWSQDKGELLGTYTFNTPFTRGVQGWVTEAGFQILIPGTEQEGGFSRAVLVSFTSDLQWQWRAPLEAAEDQQTHLFDMTLDPLGNAYVVAVAYQQSQKFDPIQQPEFFIQSFDSQGRSRYRIAPTELKFSVPKPPLNWHQTARKIGVDRDQKLYVLVDNTLYKFSAEPSTRMPSSLR